MSPPEGGTAAEADGGIMSGQTLEAINSLTVRKTLLAINNP
jgi:hypothetical protein